MSINYTTGSTKDAKAVARKMRKGGASYGEIMRKLRVPKATLSYWVSDIGLTASQRSARDGRTQKNSREALVKRNREQTGLAQERAKGEVQRFLEDIGTLSRRELLLVGGALYWAEGYKRLYYRRGREITSHKVSLTNADPLLAKMFIEFLRRCCGVSDEKIKIAVRIFPGQSKEECEKYWISRFGLKKSNLYKTLVTLSRASRGKRPPNRLPYGVAQISVADTRLFYRIMGYIEGIKRFV